MVDFKIRLCLGIRFVLSLPNTLRRIEWIYTHMSMHSCVSRANVNDVLDRQGSRLRISKSTLLLCAYIEKLDTRTRCISYLSGKIFNFETTRTS